MIVDWIYVLTAPPGSRMPHTPPPKCRISRCLPRRCRRSVCYPYARWCIFVGDRANCVARVARACGTRSVSKHRQPPQPGQNGSGYFALRISRQEAPTGRAPSDVSGLHTCGHRVQLQEWNFWDCAVSAGWASLLYRIHAEERILSHDAGWSAYAALVRHRLLPASGRRLEPSQ